MKNSIKLLLLALTFILTGCNSNEKHVQDNIAMYSKTWDDIINNGNLDAINSSNFDENVTMVSSPDNIVGIDAFKAYYSNFVTGFSNKEFTFVDIFGQGDKLVKHWRFKGTNSGEFFGIPATGKDLDIEGTTLVVMKDGKIAQEQDFFDNAVFMQQMGISSSPDNVGIIEGTYNSFAAGDVDSVLAAFDPNIVWNEAENFPYADGNPYIGGEAIVKGIFARLGGEWDNFHIANLKIHDMSNNMVLATGRYQGTYKKNGAALDIQMAHLWTLKDGKIVSFQQYADTKGIDQVIKK
ncbi:ester cyclase [Gaetbulibacter sp. M235]|uniref:ester cyclase n=1 Tax=Gaetbulibacter sp. M235 TaxID=3126510 RepID=UPI00374FCA8D